jgi:hypothetical protein
LRPVNRRKTFPYEEGTESLPAARLQKWEGKDRESFLERIEATFSVGRCPGLHREMPWPIEIGKGAQAPYQGEHFQEKSVAAGLEGGNRHCLKAMDF